MIRGADGLPVCPAARLQERRTLPEACLPAWDVEQACNNVAAMRARADEGSPLIAVLVYTWSLGVLAGLYQSALVTAHHDDQAPADVVRVARLVVVTALTVETGP